MESVTSDLKAGLARHQNDDLAGAEQVYRSILEESPDHAGAWHPLGLTSFAKRQYEQAKNGNRAGACSLRHEGGLLEQLRGHPS